MRGGEEQKKQAVISLIVRQLQKFDEVRELSKKKEEEAKTNEQIFDLPSYAKTESPEIKSTDTQKEKSIKLLQSIRSSFPYDPMNPPETLPINSLMSNPDFSNIVAQQRGMTEKIKPFNPYQPIITDKYDEYLANLRKFSMNINEKDPTSKAKTDLANFLLSVNLYDKPIADPIFSMAMPVLEGKEKINQSLIDISEGKILKGTGRLATGTLQTAFNLIPSVIGLNATLPTFKILGGEAAQLVGSDKETGQKIAEKLAPFVFGKWIGLSSLAAEKVDEEVKDREFFKKLFPDPEDQLIARELLGHVIMLGGILAGHKVDQKYINPTLDKYFPYTRGIKFDPNNKRVKNVMEQFGEEFNYRKRTEGVDKAREWAQQEFQNIIKKVSPEFFSNLKTDIRNIFKEGKNKSRESRASEPTEPISSDSYSGNSFEPTKPAIGSPRLSLPPSELGKPAPPTIPEPPAPLKPSGQGKGIKMLAPLSPTKYERGNKLESGKEIKLLSQGKEETKTITEEKPTGFAKPEKPEISRTETKPSQHEIEKEKKETQTSSEKVRGKKLLDEIETLKIRLDSFQKANMGLEASNTKKRLEKFQQQYDQLFKPPKDLSDSELEAIANKFKDVPQAQLTTDEKIRKKEITEFIKNNKPELADKIFGEPREKKQIDTAEKKAEKLKQEGKPIEAKGYEKQAERLKKKLDKSEEVTKEDIEKAKSLHRALKQEAIKVFNNLKQGDVIEFKQFGKIIKGKVYRINKDKKGKVTSIGVIRQDNNTKEKITGREFLPFGAMPQEFKPEGIYADWDTINGIDIGETAITLRDKREMDAIVKYAEYVLKSRQKQKEEEAVDKSDKGYFGYTPAEIKALKEIANITAPSKYRRWGENGLEKMYGVEVIDRLAKNKLISFQADNNHFNGITIYGKQLLDNISKSQAQEKQTKETQPVKTEAAKKETENLQGSKKQKIYDMPLSEIKLSPKDFQGRELEYSIKSFSDIVGGRIRKALNDDEISLDRAKQIIDEANKYVEKTTGRRLELSLESIPTKEFYWNEFGQIVLWKDKKGNQYVLSGHSRYNSAKFLSQFPEFKEFESVPVVMYSEAEGIDYEKAKELALTSNYMGEKQSLVSNIKYLKNLRDKGLSEEEIKQRAKEFFNKLGSRYYAYSMLSTDGKTMQMLSTMETDNDALESAYWIARARMLFPELNDSHENEMYDFLIEENRYKSSSIPKLTAWQDFISKRVNSAGWSYDKPLNLKGVNKIGYHEMQFNQALKEIDDKIKEIEKEIETKILKLKSEGAKDEQIAEAIKSLNDYRTRLIGDRLNLVNKKSEFVEQDLKQTSLFEPQPKYEFGEPKGFGELSGFDPEKIFKLLETENKGDIVKREDLFELLTEKIQSLIEPEVLKGLKLLDTDEEWKIKPEIREKIDKLFEIVAAKSEILEANIGKVKGNKIPLDILRFDVESLKERNKFVIKGYTILKDTASKTLYKNKEVIVSSDYHIGRLLGSMPKVVGIYYSETDREKGKIEYVPSKDLETVWDDDYYWYAIIETNAVKAETFAKNYFKDAFSTAPHLLRLRKISEKEKAKLIDDSGTLKLKQQEARILLREKQVEFASNSKIKDAEGNPLPVFIATKSGISQYDPEKYDIENYFGKAIYGTTQLRDVENYLGNAKEKLNKIQNDTERAEKKLISYLEDGDPDNFLATLQQYTDLPISKTLIDFAYNYKKKRTEEEEKQIKKELNEIIFSYFSDRYVNSTVNVTYFNIENPFILFPKDSRPRIEALIQLSEDLTKETYVNYSDLEDALRQVNLSMYNISAGYEIISAIENKFRYYLVNKGEYSFDEETEEEDFGEVKASELIQILTDFFYEDVDSYYDADTGKVVSGDIIRQIIEALGYDGVVMVDVNAHFNAYRDVVTNHIIAFRTNQVHVDKYNYFEDSDIQIKDKQAIKENNTVFNNIIEQQRLNKVPDELVGKMIFVNPDYEQNIIEGSLESGSMDDIPVYINDEGVFNVIALKKDINESLDNKSLKEISESLTIYFPIDIIKELLDAYGLTEIPQTKFKSLLPADLSTREFKINMLEEAIEKAKFNFYSNFVSRKPYESIIDFNKRAQKEKPELIKYGEYLSSVIEKAFENQAKAKNYDELPPMNFRIRDLIKDLISHLISHRPGSDKIYIQVSYGKTKKIFFPKTTSTIIGSDLTELREKQVFYEAEESEEDVILTHYLSPENLIKAVKFKGNLIIPSLALHRRSFEFFDDLQPTDSDSPCVLIGAKDILFKENVKIYGRDAWTMSVPRTLSILIDKKTMQTVIEKFAKDLLKEADNNKLDVYITIQNEQTNENKNIRIRTPKDLTDYYIKHVIKTSHHIRKEDNIINNFGEKVEGNYFEFNHLYLGYIKTNIRYARKDNPKDGFIEFNSRYNGNHNLISFVNNLFIENNLPYVQTFFLKEIIENVAGEEKPGWKEQQPLSESFINEFVEFARIFGDPRAQTIGKIAGWNIGREIKNFDELREQKDRLLFYLEGNNKANELIKDFADKHKLTYDKFYRILNEYAVINGRLQPQKIIEGIKNEEAWKEIIPNPKEFVDDLNKLIDDVNKASVGYFEAKAYGLFNLSNFSKAIIPNTYAGQLQKALEQHGLEVIVYHDAEDFEENRLTIFDKVYEEGIKVAEADIFDDYSGTGLFGNDEKAPPKSKNSQKLAELKARKTHLELVIEKAKERGLYNPQFEGSTKLNSDVVMEATEELNSIKKQIAALEKKFKESAPKNQIDIFGGIYDEDVNGIVEPQKPPKKAIDDQIELFQKEIRIKQGQLESARNQLDLFNELQEEIKDLNKAIDTLEYAKQKFQDIDEEELKRRGEEGQKIRKEVSKIVQEFIDTTKNRELNKLNTFAVDYENAKKKLIDYLESVKGNDYWKTNEDSYSIFKEQVTRGFERLSKLIHLGIETPSDVIKIGNYIVDSWSGKKLFNKKFLENINIEINQRLRLKSQNMFGIKAPVGNDVKSYADYFKTIAETFDYLNDEKVEHAYFYVEVKDSKEPIILFSGVGDDASVSINSELLQLLFSKLKDSNKTVKRITMIHNHPSGALTPSDKDIRARNSLRKIVNNYFPEAEYSDVIIDARRGFFSVYSQHKTEYFKYDPEEFKHFPKKLLNKVYRISRDVFLEKDLPNFVSQEFQINTKTIVSKLLFSRYNIYGKTFGFLLNHGITKAVFPINVRQYISVKEDFIKELKLLTGTDKLLLVSFQTAADDNFKRILELAAVKSNAADWTIILPVPSEPDNAKIIKQNANTFLSVLEKISNPEYYTELFKDINGDNFDINLLLREPEPDFNKFEKKMREFEKQMPAKLSEEEERRLKELNSLYELTKDEREELERLRKKKQDLLKSDPFVRKRLSTFIKDKIKYYKQGYREGQIDLARALRKIETDILDYARATLPKYYFKRSEVTQIMVKLRNARDIDSMEAAFLKIDEIANKVYKRYVFEKLNRMLRGINKDSRDKGIPNSIINLAKAKRNIEKLEQNIQRLNAINQQRELSDDEEAELYFSTKMMNLSMMTTEQIDEFAEELKSFINGRKTRFQMWQEKEKERIGKLRAEAIAVITGSKGIMPEDTFRKVKLSQKKRSEIAHRILQYDNMMHSFEWLMDALSKYDKSSETLNSFLNRYFATKVAQATIEKNEAVKNYKKIIKHGLEESFNLKGNKLYKLLDELSEVMPTGVFKKVPKLNSQGQTEFTEVELVMSQNEIAKLLLEWEDKTLQKTFEKMNIDPDVIFNLRRILHPGLKNWIRWNRNFYNQYYYTVNDVYKKVKGYDLPYNPYYSPIARDINITQMDSEFLGDTYEFTSIYNGHLQPRTSNSLPLKRQDINLVLMEHILEMEHFKHYAPIMKDLRGVFNSKEVRTAIIQYHDAFMLKILNKFINDFARGGVESKLVVGYLDKLRSNFAKAKIGLNPTVFVKQLTSFPAYMMEIPSKDFFAGVLDFWLNPIGRAKFLMRNSKYMQSRYEKGWERDIILALSQAKKTFKKQISGRLTFTQFSMMLAQIGDGAAIMLGGWSVYKYHYNKYLKQGLSSSEAQKLAIFKFEEATKRSQQSGEIEDLGDMQRGGSWAKLWTLFMTAPKSYYSSVSGAVRNLYFGRGSKIKNLKRLFVAHVLLPTLFQYAADGFYFNYKHLLRAAILGSLNGIFIFGNLLEILVKELFGEKTWDFEGNPIESIGKESIEAAQSIRKLIDREEITAEDVFETVDDLATAVSSYIGIPYQPISRIQKGVDRYFKGKTLSPMEMLGFNRKLFEPEPEPEPKEIKLIKEKESRLNKLRKEARETLDKDTIEKVKALKREIEEMKKSKVWKEYLNKQKEEKKKDIFYERPKVKDNMMQDFQLNNFGF